MHSVTQVRRALAAVALGLVFPPTASAHGLASTAIGRWEFTPLVVMPMSYFLLRNQEKLNPVTVMGILVTLAGTILTMLTSSKP